MPTTFIHFKNNYYLYDKGLSVNKKGFTIGGYESAWLADLVAAFVFEKPEDLFSDLVFMKTYRDDALCISDETKTTNELCDWLEVFLRRVNEVLGSEHLKFTAKMWNPKAPESEIPENKKVSINRNIAFPCLDIEMYWYQEESLASKVHR